MKVRMLWMVAALALGAKAAADEPMVAETPQLTETSEICESLRHCKADTDCPNGDRCLTPCGVCSTGIKKPGVATINANAKPVWKGKDGQVPGVNGVEEIHCEDGALPSPVGSAGPIRGKKATQNDYNYCRAIMMMPRKGCSGNWAVATNVNGIKGQAIAYCVPNPYVPEGAQAANTGHYSRSPEELENEIKRLREQQEQEQRTAQQERQKAETARQQAEQTKREAEATRRREEQTRQQREDTLRQDIQKVSGRMEEERRQAEQRHAAELHQIMNRSTGVVHLAVGSTYWYNIQAGHFALASIGIGAENPSHNFRFTLNVIGGMSPAFWEHQRGGALGGMMSFMWKLPRIKRLQLGLFLAGVTDITARYPLSWDLYTGLQANIVLLGARPQGDAPPHNQLLLVFNFGPGIGGATPTKAGDGESAPAPSGPMYFRGNGLAAVALQYNYNL